MAVQDIKDYVELGEPSGRGNVLAIQPFVRPADYTSEGAFSLRMNGYLDEARQRGWVTDRTVAVFPEYVGAWLVALGEGVGVYRAKSVASAMGALARAHPVGFIGRWLGAGARDRTRAALFRLKAEQMAAVYQATFSTLARTYAVSIVAGSIVLPAPTLVGGRLEAGEGPLTNVAVVYRSDGAAVALSRKVYPTADEVGWIAPGRLEDLPVVNTGSGRMGVLVCADAWYPEPYRVLEEKGAEIVAVPSFLPGDDVWGRPWRGYSGQPAPDDVDAGDVDVIDEGEAWVKYGMIGRIDASGATCGVNVFLRGSLWDLGSDGCTMVVLDEDTYRTERVAGAALVTVWL